MSPTYDHGGNVFTIARQLGLAPAEITDFSASINPMGLWPSVREAVLSALDSLVHYPDSSHHALKAALAEHHGLAPVNFAIANGSTELIYHLPSMVSGRRALIVTPSFSEYPRSLVQCNWDISQFPLSATNGFELDPNALRQALAEGFDLLYLCNPGNPSGRLYPSETVEQIRESCAAADTFLVLDEAFMDFCEEGSAKGSAMGDNNMVILRSMTKFFGMPGLRLGYAIACKNLTQRLGAMGGPWNVNTLALAAGVAALKDREWIRGTRELIIREREHLCLLLSSLPMLRVFPSSANYLLIELTGGLTARELQGRLLQQRMLIRDCASFAGLSPAFFRIAVRTREENERLVGYLKEILTP